jgi:hypothetical protein
MRKYIYITLISISVISCHSEKTIDETFIEENISNEVKENETVFNEELYHKEFYDFFKNSNSEKLVWDSIFHISVSGNDTAHISHIPRTLSLKKQYSFVNSKGTMVNITRINFTTLNVEVKTADTLYNFNAFLSPHFILGCETREIGDSYAVSGYEYFTKDSLNDIFSLVIAEDSDDVTQTIYLFLESDKNPFSNPFIKKKD